MQRVIVVIVGIVFAIILGFIFGSLFMEQGFSVSHWLPGGMLTATACCIIAFVTNVLLKSQRMMRRQEGVKRFASGTSFYYTGRGTDELVDRMRLLIGYGSSAWIENSLSETTSDVSTMVGDLSILVSTSGGRSKTVTRTVAFFRDSDLRMPHFSLQPESSMLSWMGDLVGVQDVDFGSHVVFSDAYHLSADRPELARELFTQELLDYFDGHLGLEIRGNREQLLILAAEQIEVSRLPKFISQSQQIFSLFRESISNLDNVEEARQSVAEVPSDPLRDTPEEDSKGVVSGSPLAQLAEANWVDLDDVMEFLSHPIPRSAPFKILQQRNTIGGAMLIGFLSLLFLMGLPWLVIGVLIWGKEGAISTMMIGATLTLFTGSAIGWKISQRRRNHALLRNGKVVPSKILHVRNKRAWGQTEAIYEVDAVYHADGSDHQKTFTVHGVRGELAQDALDRGEETPMLIDPSNPENCILCIQLTTHVRLSL